MFDHLTYHCWGAGDFTKGRGQSRGFCVYTNPAGDQIVENFVSDKFSLGQKIINGPVTLTSGTGKFAGVTCTGTWSDDGATYRPTEKGTFFTHGIHHFKCQFP
jgi:hypothetical protein